MLEIDCSGLRFIDSSGLDMLVSRQERIGKKLMLFDVAPEMHRIFEVTGLEEVFVLRYRG